MVLGTSDSSPAHDLSSTPEAAVEARGPIMVVDDDRDIREILTDVLTDAGYDVVTASNGLEALALLKEVTPCLILLDLNMPAMDGVEFRRRQREDSIAMQVPTVVMSAMHKMYERIAGLDVDDAVAKPVELKRLLEVVRRYAPKPK